ncbi:MAG: AraC family ligand binding domain-containing protein, partial [Clostridia bacterium]|nr:AraC family ligand binding domain-containing protein [Clostridia bacterium]
MKNTQFVHDKYSSYNIIIANAPKYHVSKHDHSHLEVYYVIKGYVQVTVNNQTKILGKDQLSVCDSFDEHSYTPISNDTKSVYVTVPENLVSKLDAWKKHKKFTENFITDRKITKKFRTCIY